MSAGSTAYCGIDGQVVDEVVEAPEIPEVPEEPARSAKRGGLLDRIRGVKPKLEDAAEKPKVAAKTKLVEPKAPKTVAPSVKPPLIPRRPPGVAPRRQLKNLDGNGNAKGDTAKKETAKKKPAGANVRLAAMPATKQPQARKEAGEKVQKPDIALPQDAIKSVKSGGGVAPLEHLTNSKNKKKKGKTADAVTEGEESSKKRGVGSRRERGARDERPMGSRPSRQSRRPSRNHSSFRRRHRSGPTVNTAAPRKENVVLQLPCTVREFSEAAGVPKVKVLFAIKQLGDESNKTINSLIEDEMVEMLVEELAIELEIREYQSLEDELLAEFDVEQEEVLSLIHI